MQRSALKRSTPLVAKTPMKRTPMVKRSRKPARTKAVSTYMGRVAALGCIVCRNLGFGPTPAELHHPRFLAGAGQKADDKDVIGLCAQHHRLGGYGVAYHAGPEEWERRYGTEEELLEQTRREVGAASEGMKQDA